MSKSYRKRDARGMNFVEVAIAIVVLALGLMPIFSMMMSGTRQSAFTEYHLFASVRAQRIAEELLTFSSRNFAAVEEAAVEPKALLAAITSQDGAFPEEYVSKLATGSYAEKVLVRRLDDGLYMLDVTVTWAFPAERPGLERAHEFTLHRTLSRPDVSFTEEIPLAVDAAPVS